MDQSIILRKAVSEDSKRLAELASELGYICQTKEIKKRLEKYENNDKEIVLVLEKNGYVVAWTSLYIVEHFYLEPFVELDGFVVDEKFRGQGLGKLLMDEAEKWVKEQGHTLVKLKTNATRKKAHHFYEKYGFEKTKEQYVYVKIVD